MNSRIYVYIYVIYILGAFWGACSLGTPVGVTPEVQGPGATINYGFGELRGNLERTNQGSS